MNHDFTHALFVRLSLGFGLASAAIIVAYLLRRPRLTGPTKVWLLFGIGVLPISAAVSGNYAGWEVLKGRNFCASCHTMDLHTRDAADPSSTTLAAIHSRNPMFGGASCYMCHRDYKVFGEVTTKLGGMKHLWVYYTKYAGSERRPDLALYKPFPNSSCLQCHSTTLPGWLAQDEHASMLDSLRSGEVSCATCHAPVHPPSGAK